MPESFLSRTEKTDLPLIIEIENASFPNPWSLSQLSSVLEKTLVYRKNGSIRGFICLEFPADETHILHMAVHPKFRRQGIGKKMMEEVLKYPSKVFFLEVRENNAAAQKLYEGFGFKVIAKRENYYQDNDETALVMRLNKND